MHLWILVPFIVVASAGPTQAQSAERVDHYLDLTSGGQQPTLPAVAEGGAAGYSGRRTEKPPLQLRLASVDRDQYTVGDRVVYEVRLRNVGQQSFDIPWSVDGELVEQYRPVIRASLSLLVTDRSNWEQGIGSAVLAGSRLVPGSILTLHPGEVASILVERSTHSLEASAARRLAAAHSPTVRAVFLLQLDDTMERFVSMNAVPVRFVLRTPTPARVPR